MPPGNNQAQIVLTAQDQVSSVLHAIAQNMATVRDGARQLESVQRPFKGISEDLATITRGVKEFAGDLRDVDYQNLSRMFRSIREDLAALPGENKATVAFRAITREVQEAEAALHSLGAMEVNTKGIQPALDVISQMRAGIKAIALEQAPLRTLQESLADVAKGLRAAAPDIPHLEDYTRKLEQTRKELDALAKMPTVPRSTVRETRRDLRQMEEDISAYRGLQPAGESEDRLAPLFDRLSRSRGEVRREQVQHEPFARLNDQIHKLTEDFKRVGAQAAPELIEGFKESLRHAREDLAGTSGTLPPARLLELSAQVRTMERALAVVQGDRRALPIRTRMEPLHDAFGRAMGLLDEQDAVASPHRQIREQMGALGQSLRLSSRDLGKQAFADIRREIRLTEAALKEMAQAPGALRGELKADQMALRQLKGELTQAEREQSVGGRFINRVQGAFGNFRQGLLSPLGLGIGAAGLGALMVKAVNAYMEHEVNLTGAAARFGTPGLQGTNRLRAFSASFTSSGLRPQETLALADQLRALGLHRDDLGQIMKVHQATGMDAGQVVGAMGLLNPALRGGVAGREFALADRLAAGADLAGMRERRPEFLTAVTSALRGLADQNGSQLSSSRLAPLVASMAQLAGRNPTLQTPEGVQRVGMGLEHMMTQGGTAWKSLLFRSGLSIADITMGDWVNQPQAINHVLSRITRELPRSAYVTGRKGDKDYRDALRMVFFNATGDRGLANSLADTAISGRPLAAGEELRRLHAGLDPRATSNTPGFHIRQNRAQLANVEQGAGKFLGEPLVEFERLGLDLVGGKLSLGDFGKRLMDINRRNPVAAPLIEATVLAPVLGKIAESGSGVASVFRNLAEAGVSLLGKGAGGLSAGEAGVGIANTAALGGAARFGLWGLAAAGATVGSFKLWDLWQDHQVKSEQERHVAKMKLMGAATRDVTRLLVHNHGKIGHRDLGQISEGLAEGALQSNISGELLTAQAMLESGFDKHARSTAGAVGIAQFMPGTARGMRVKGNDGRWHQLDPRNIRDSLVGMARYDRRLLDRLTREYRVDPAEAIPMMLTSYNMGGGGFEHALTRYVQDHNRAHPRRTIGAKDVRFSDLLGATFKDARGTTHNRYLPDEAFRYASGVEKYLGQVLGPQQVGDVSPQQAGTIIYVDARGASDPRAMERAGDRAAHKIAAAHSPRASVHRVHKAPINPPSREHHSPIKGAPAR